MVLEEATHLLQHGQFQEGIDLIDDAIVEMDPNSTEYKTLNALKSRLYYHHARLDQALYWIKQILTGEGDNPEWLLYQVIYQFGLGELFPARQTLEALDYLVDEEVSPDRIPTLSYYHYAKGLFDEFDGEIERAKSHFEKSLEYRQMLDDQFESNVILYRLATICRTQGRIDQAQQYLKQSLELSRSLRLVKEIATAVTLLGQDRMMSSDYIEAVPYLEEGVEKWRQQGSPFGIIWALGELAIVNYLSGNQQQALQQYQEIIELAAPVMPPFYLSAHYLKLIRFALGQDQSEMVERLVHEFEEIEQQTDNKYITTRLDLVKSLVALHENRVSLKFAQRPELERLQEVQEMEVRLVSLICDIRLLLLEYDMTKQTLFKEEIVEETDEKIDQLLNYIRLKNNISFEVHAALLRSKLEILSHDPQLIMQIIDQLRHETSSSDLDLPSIFEKTGTDTEHLSWGSGFEFDKDLHSIPTLKIVLYLLPRTWVTFSDLQQGTGLSAGHLSGKTRSLEEKGFLLKDKQFINQTSTTVFTLTSSGFVRFKEYMKKLSTLLGNIID